MFPHFFSNLKFNRVIASSDGLYIPFNVSILKNASKVVDKNNEE